MDRNEAAFVFLTVKISRHYRDELKKIAAKNNRTAQAQTRHYLMGCVNEDQKRGLIG